MLEGGGLEQPHPGGCRAHVLSARCTRQVAPLQCSPPVLGLLGGGPGQSLGGRPQARLLLRWGRGCAVLVGTGPCATCWARLLPGQRSAARLLAWVNIFYLGNLASVCLPGAFIFIAVASRCSCVPGPLPHGRALREVFPSAILEALGAASLLPSVLVATSPGRLLQAGAACPGSWLEPRGGQGSWAGGAVPPASLQLGLGEHHEGRARSWREGEGGGLWLLE